LFIGGIKDRAEIDLVSKNAEMTDFATLPKWRGIFGGKSVRLDQNARKTLSVAILA